MRHERLQIRQDLKSCSWHSWVEFVADAKRRRAQAATKLSAAAWAAEKQELLAEIAQLKRQLAQDRLRHASAEAARPQLDEATVACAQELVVAPAPEKLPQRDGVKIILLGDSAVGKSKLVERFLMDG